MKKCLALLLGMLLCAAFGAAAEEQFGELYFEDRAGKQLPLGVYYRMKR